MITGPKNQAPHPAIQRFAIGLPMLDLSLDEFGYSVFVFLILCWHCTVRHYDNEALALFSYVRY
jgi:hypothetical protein